MHQLHKLLRLCMILTDSSTCVCLQLVLSQLGFVFDDVAHLDDGKWLRGIEVLRTRRHIVDILKPEVHVLERDRFTAMCRQ